MEMFSSGDDLEQDLRTKGDYAVTEGGGRLNCGGLYYVCPISVLSRERSLAFALPPGVRGRDHCPWIEEKISMSGCQVAIINWYR